MKCVSSYSVIVCKYVKNTIKTMFLGDIDFYILGIFPGRASGLKSYPARRWEYESPHVILGPAIFEVDVAKLPSAFVN